MKKGDRVTYSAWGVKVRNPRQPDRIGKVFHVAQTGDVGVIWAGCKTTQMIKGDYLRVIEEKSDAAETRDTED